MGFDELLMQFGNELKYDVPDQYVLNRAKERADRIVIQAQELQDRIKKRDAETEKVTPTPSKSGKSVAKDETGAVTDAMSDTMKRKGDGKRWWQWEEEAKGEVDLAKRDAIYRKGIEELPNSVELLGNYALYLEQIKKDSDAAEAMYKRAIEADPKLANNLGNYADFLDAVRKNSDAAEAMYKRAIEADPKHANNLGNYAHFLANNRKDFDAAGVMYKRAIEADPKHANNLGGYALLLERMHKDSDAAEPMYKRAIEADPKHASNLGNYTKLILASGRIEEGLSRLNEVFAILKDREPSAVHEECWMYAYCCGPTENRAESLTRLKSILSKTDIRTGDWDFSGVIAQAEKMKHTEANWLPKLAAVLSGKASPKTLDKWAAWKNA
jgi:Tfp pilus assembly protein PilF